MPHDPYARLAGALRMDPWAGRAACVGQWAVLEGPDERAAKALCLDCPVIADCTTWVMPLGERDDPGGVRAGLTLKERRRMRRKAGAVRAARRAQARARRAAALTELVRDAAGMDGERPVLPPVTPEQAAANLAALAAAIEA